VSVAGDGIATLTFTRPDASNALDLPAARELQGAVDEVAASGARVLAIRAEGKVFCAGGDLGSMVDAEEPRGYLEELARAVDAALRDLTRLEMPVVAVVQGSVAGGGLAVVLSADVVVSAASARYLMAYSQVG
jgi:2-(1,2-epoxy-1,2-dihydrophenyl)acetyl-CoA isomerase